MPRPRQTEGALAVWRVLPKFTSSIKIQETWYLNLETGDPMSVLKMLVRFALSATLLWVGAGRALAQNDSTVVAEVGGVKVTLGELEQQESAKLLSAHYQYYQAQSKALDALIDKKVLEQKAKSENLTV